MAVISAGICAAYGAEHTFAYTYEFEPTVNWTENVEPAIRAATTVAGAAHVDGNCAPLLASEDFGAFLRVIPGNYMFIGSGVDGAPLHNPHYDFNDGLLEKGAAYFAAIARQRASAPKYRRRLASTGEQRCEREYRGSSPLRGGAFHCHDKPGQVRPQPARFVQPTKRHSPSHSGERCRDLTSVLRDSGGA